MLSERKERMWRLGRLVFVEAADLSYGSRKGTTAWRRSILHKDLCDVPPGDPWVGLQLTLCFRPLAVGVKARAKDEVMRLPRGA